MKKYTNSIYLLGVIALLLVACTKEEKKDKTFVLQAPTNASLQKTALDANQTTLWESNDVIYINGTGDNYKAMVTVTNHEAVAQAAHDIISENNYFNDCYSFQCKRHLNRIQLFLAQPTNVEHIHDNWSRKNRGCYKRIFLAELFPR